MPTGVYERTPEHLEKLRAGRARAAAERKLHPRKTKKAKKAKRATSASVIRDYAAEYARRAKKAGARPTTHPSRARKPGSPSWTPERLAKFQATMAAKRKVREAAAGARQQKRTAKLALLNGPVRKPRVVKGQAASVTVLEADGTLSTYVLTTVQAYVRQP